ncbi:MAG TPA: hypothetical protein VGC11_00260 [Acidimicrobiia bacterium]|jgi:hypothetical protein
MKTMRRALLVAAAAAVVGVATLGSAFASDDAVLLATEEATTPPTEVPGTGPVPAEEAPAPEAEPEDEPWTARFLAPTVLAIGVITLLVSAGYYLVVVRGRYEVID